jgi:hypothetical protein
VAGIAGDDWHEAIDMSGAQVAVAAWCPDWWPATTRVLIRRVALDPAQVSADPRSRGRRTLHSAQRALPLPELGRAGAIYAYSFILTNLDVSTTDKAIAAEHWYRHRTTVENRFRDGRHGAAPPPPTQRTRSCQHRVRVGRAARREYGRLAAHLAAIAIADARIEARSHWLAGP